MGNGEKIGIITKLAKTGAFCKTWEGQIVRGGLSGGSGVMGAPFDFTVESDELAKKVQDIMDKQQEVKISYHVEGATFCRSDSEDHFLTNIEVIGKGAGAPSQPSLASQAGASGPMPAAQAAESSAGVSLDRQKIADEIARQNAEILKQNQQLIDLLKK
jgi:hypothetical protein